ncbi:MAG: TonB-dependent receptor [Gammaproteobacteria bacterium]|nr:TonB-dependent receptor [Gammaproteobacteria bacterium]
MKWTHTTLSLLLLPVVASGQQSTPLETIVIEARHWNESLQDIPASIKVVDSKDINGSGLNQIERLIQYTANTTIENSSVQPRIVIRGNASLDTGTSTPVGYMLDDVSLPLGVKQATDWLNIDTIEIIKGAQGSFYGRNTEAGVIKVQTKTPGFETQAWAQYRYLQTDGSNSWVSGHEVETGVSGGVDDIAASLNMKYLSADSPYYNLYPRSNDENKLEKLNIVGALTYYLGSDTEINFRSHWQDSDGGRAKMRYLTGQFATDAFTVNYSTPTDDQQRSAIQSLRIDHEFGNKKLTAITGYTDYAQEFVMDLDTGPAPIPATLSDFNDKMLSQEFRLATTGDPRLKWSIGTHFYQQDTDIDFTMGMQSLRRISSNEQHGLAGFGHAQYQINSQLSLAAGARVERISQKGQQSLSNMMVNAAYSEKLSETQVLPTITATYHLTQDALLYLSWSNGYLPGGFNYSSATSAETFTYEDEHTTSYEFGYKSKWLDQTINSDLSVFFNQIKDKQMIDILPGFTQKISNAAKAEIYGIEYSINARLNNQWSILANLGWQQGEAKEHIAQVFFNGQTGTQILSDNSLPYTPDFTWALTVNYQPVSAMTTQMVVRGSDNYYFDSANTLEQDSYEAVDLTMTYQFDPVTVTLAANNIFNESVFSRAINTPNGVVVEDTQERTISLTAKYQW